MAILLAAISLRAGDVPLGVITQASGAHVASGLVSAGATVFDGDHLFTATKGFLEVQSGSARFYLGGDSGVTLHAAAKWANAELTTGSLVFSTAAADLVEVQVNGASIRPAAPVPTTAQVKILRVKELLITARHGALEFSYRGENVTIPEGVSYQIFLDQPEASSAPGSGDRSPAHKGAREGKFFKVAMIASIVAVGGVTIWAIHEALESPDRP